ncbi:MAG: Gfo/Idh/MocA family oxidoreductase [Candidatus Omnitrophica bacterium]|nr:Gfo/Idh/MocA family oxidoreductase [Candidatus Omnitrophota bacterium]
MKILIIGLGSIGRRHLKTVKSIDPTIEAAVLREHSKDKDVGDVAGLVAEVFLKRDDALAWRPDAVIIANPAPYHIETAGIFASGGSHIFLEKPLSDSLEGIDDLLALCREQKCVLMVGYCLRFLEPLKVLKKEIDAGRIGKVLHIHATVGRYLPDWRPGQDYRQTVSARKDSGGGVILELSHEIDYVRWLMGEVAKIDSLVAKISEFDIDVEDIAEINLRFESGAIGHIHMDMLDRAANRSCRIVGTEGTMKWEYDGNHSVKLYDAQAEKWISLWEKEGFDYNRMFIDQFNNFFECIKNGQEPLINGEEGRRVLELVMEAKNSSQQGVVV